MDIFPSFPGLFKSLINIIRILSLYNIRNQYVTHTHSCARFTGNQGTRCHIPRPWFLPRDTASGNPHRSTDGSCLMTIFFLSPAAILTSKTITQTSKLSFGTVQRDINGTPNDGRMLGSIRKFTKEIYNKTHWYENQAYSL